MVLFAAQAAVDLRLPMQAHPAMAPVRPKATPSYSFNPG